MRISLSEQIRLAALEHHLGDQYPDLAAEMKVFGYCSELPSAGRQHSFGLKSWSWARHMALWMAGIAVIAMLALMLLPVLAGPTRCPQPVAGKAHSDVQSPAACASPHAGG
ncbi:MAG TPA: hypothetical protein VGJ14_11900 [Sporichthyaceae bacterium]|jgi:hypothetical protein